MIARPCSVPLARDQAGVVSRRRTLPQATDSAGFEKENTASSAFSGRLRARSDPRRLEVLLFSKQFLHEGMVRVLVLIESVTTEKSRAEAPKDGVVRQNLAEEPLLPVR